MKSTRSADFCADQIDVITNFAVITNVVIKWMYCSIFFMHMNMHMLAVYSVLFTFHCVISAYTFYCLLPIGTYF